jgi:hypothetical protein
MLVGSTPLVHSLILEEEPPLGLSRAYGVVERIQLIVRIGTSCRIAENGPTADSC